MKLCFTGILQSELDNIKDVWSNHGIKNSRNSECPGRRPVVLYCITEVMVQQIAPALARKKLDQALRFCVYPSLVNCTEDFLSLASLIMTEENLRLSKNTQKTESARRRNNFKIHKQTHLFLEANTNLRQFFPQIRDCLP